MNEDETVALTICEIFQNQQDTRAVDDQDVLKIYSLYKRSAQEFMKILGACIINIFQNSKKMTKPQMNTYEKLLDLVFKKIHDASFVDVETYKKMKQESCHNNNIADAQNLKYDYFKLSWAHERAIIYFVKIFNYGLGCQINLVQMFCAKCLINLFKNFDNGQKDFLERLLKNSDFDENDEDSIEDLENEDNNPSLIQNIIEGSIIMMQSARQEQVRMAGLKIGSYLQFQDRENLLLNQLVEIMCSDDKVAIRKSAVYNLQLNQNTVPYLIKRMRDKDSDVQAEVLNKIKKSKVDIFS